MLNIIIGIGMYLTLVYSLIVSSFEMFFGVEAARVIMDRYDYSYNIPNTTVYISIEALPRDVYKDTKALTSILLTMSALTYLLAILAIANMICFNKCRPWWPKEYLVGLMSFSTTMIPFAYGAFVLWKYKTMSDADKDVWNSVDSRFMYVFSQSETLVILNAFPFAVWTVLCVAFGIHYLRQG